MFLKTFENVLIFCNFFLPKGSFLPTMPEEVLSAEIKNELQRMEEIANKSYHTVTWYRKCQKRNSYFAIVVYFIKKKI